MHFPTPTTVYSHDLLHRFAAEISETIQLNRACRNPCAFRQNNHIQINGTNFFNKSVTCQQTQRIFKVTTQNVENASAFEHTSV